MKYEGQNTVDHDGVVGQPFRQSSWWKKREWVISEAGHDPARQVELLGRVKLQPQYSALFIQRLNGQIGMHIIKHDPYS